MLGSHWRHISPLLHVVPVSLVLRGPCLGKWCAGAVAAWVEKVDAPTCLREMPLARCDACGENEDAPSDADRAKGISSIRGSSIV